MSDRPIPHRFDDAQLEAIRGRLSGLVRARLRGEARRAAVLVPLCHVEGRASVLFTRRSEKVGTHKGQVSFPGGMADEGDRDVEQTALRELEEEIGFPGARVTVLGRFHDARAITGVHVTPVVGFLGELDPRRLVPNPDEIDAVFTLTLEELVDPSRRYNQFHGPRGPIPVFDAGPFPVWGLTAYILEGVLKEALGLALPPASGG